LTHFSPKILDPFRAEQTARRIFPNTKAGRDGTVVTLAFQDEGV
ncbi:MAG TPA: ribonuclease Z, partial [Ktedonobacter sp.]|nr:ribonuclease Z [Ktedonobacter sp.]